MNTRPLLACLFLFSIAGSTLAAEPQSGDFLRDIAPILSQNCIACHNAKKAEGGLSLESHKAVLAGGDSGAAVIAANVDEGTLIERVTSEDDPMPPEGNSVGAKRLTSEQIELFRRWIAAGAVGPVEGAGQNLQWQPVPQGLQPVYALAASPDGNHLAFGRGGLVSVTRQVSGTEETPLTQPLIDPATKQTLGTESAAYSATHLDIVQSLAFSPDSGRLATGGYRTVKIWRKKTEPTHSLSGLSQPTGLSAISPDGRWIAQSFGDHVLEITDRQSGRAQRYLTTHSAEVTALAWLATPPRLVSADRAGQVALTDIVSDLVESIPLPNGLVCQSLQRIDDARLLVIDDQRRLHVAQISLDEATGKRSFATNEIAGFETVAATAVTQPTPNQAVIAQADGKLKLVSLPEFNIIREIGTPTGIQTVEISTSGGLIATLPTSGPAQLWKAGTGELHASLNQDPTHTRLLATGAGNVARQKSWIETLAAKIPELQTAANQEVEATKKVQELRDKAAEALAVKVNEVAMATTGVTEAEAAVAAAEAAVAEAMKQVEAKKAELEAKRSALAETEKQKMAADAELAKRDQALATATDSSQRAAAKIPAWEGRVAEEKSQLTNLETEFAAVQARVPATDQPTALTFTPDGKQLAVTHGDQRLR
ncbi:MAG: c-type cytochrome domain-containing protein, partial [Pirellulaceae bacterium]